MSRFDSRGYRNWLYFIMEQVLDPTKGFERLVSVGTTTLLMSYQRMDLDRIPFLKRRESVAQVVAASAAAPLYYQMLEYENKFLLDGTLKHVIDVESAVERCLEIVRSESDIIIDVIMVASQGAEVVEPENEDSLYNHWTELQKSMGKHTLVVYRHLLSPMKENINDFEWKNFDNNYTKHMYEIGKRDAAEVVARKEGERFNKLIEKTKKSLF